MPFKLDDTGFGGTGTIKDYFSPATWGLEGEPSAFDERDTALDRLHIQLFSEFIGLTGDEEITVVWTSTYEEFDEAKAKPGLNLVCFQPDDPIEVLYRDGQPLAGFYASFRGIYQAGGWVSEPSGKYVEEYFAANFGPEPHNEWVAYPNTCADIVKDLVFAKGIFDRTDVVEDEPFAFES